MAQYSVRLMQTVIEECWVTVEAENETEAEAKAFQEAMDGNYQWSFYETTDQEPEVITCEEIKSAA